MYQILSMTKNLYYRVSEMARSDCAVSCKLHDIIHCESKQHPHWLLSISLLIIDRFLKICMGLHGCFSDRQSNVYTSSWVWVCRRRWDAKFPQTQNYTKRDSKICFFCSSVTHLGFSLISALGKTFHSNPLQQATAVLSYNELIKAQTYWSTN